jgi:hypothetical protein
MPISTPTRPYIRPFLHKTAVKWYRLAAEQGNVAAQYNLDLMYAKGQGVPQYDKTAVKWWTLAAKQGNADAQSALGFMYHKGEGVPQDNKTAVKWYKLAAKQGDADAQSNLNKIKSRLVSKGIDDCLFDEIKKVTGPETKKIVENTAAISWRKNLWIGYCESTTNPYDPNAR